MPCCAISTIKLAADMPARDKGIQAHCTAQMQPVLQALSDAWIVLRTHQVTLTFDDRDAELRLRRRVNARACDSRAITSPRYGRAGRPCCSRNTDIFFQLICHFKRSTLQMAFARCVVRSVPLLRTHGWNLVDQTRRRQALAGTRVAITSLDLQR